MTLEQMQARLAALIDMRFRGVRSQSYDGKMVSFATDAELAAAITDLERRIESADGGQRRSRVRRPYAVKDL
jgi:hypothetical protein